jgi:ribosome maturation factor RimP
MIIDLKGQLEQLIVPILDGEGFELVELKLARFRKNYRLQIFIDSDNGVTLDACARISNLIGTALDLSEMIDIKYTLEISSPGLDRPLHSEKEFRRRIGREIEIEMMVDNKAQLIRGTLTGVENAKLLLSDTDGNREIALTQVRQGREVF